MGVARDERGMLCDLFDELGADAPTLCDGWNTRDLAAHLAVREHRPDAAVGILVKPLAGHTARVQHSFAAKPWPELVDLVRSGPPAWSPFRLEAVDEAANGMEFFVHHEDVRRARSDWQPRPADPVRDAVLWRAVGRVARLTYRRSPVGVALRVPNGEVLVAKQGPRTVTLVGEPGELLLHACGRAEARLDAEGDRDDVAIVHSLHRSF
jgi:uncharacterized protein (TIGR03085 family)